MKKNPTNNVCLRTPIQDDDSTLFPFQFVYETLPSKLTFKNFGIVVTGGGKLRLGVTALDRHMTSASKTYNTVADNFVFHDYTLL
jgi:hypothetical protein